jgi:hypothetical protein
MYHKIILAGGSGFLGKAMADYYKDKAEEIIILSRRKGINRENIRFELWDGKDEASFAKHLENSDLLINLSGKNVNCRYTKENREEIFRSRLEPTDALEKAIQSIQRPPKLWLQAASATIYRHAEDRLQDEETGETGNGFSVDVCKAWEAHFRKWETPATRKAVLRIGMVLGRDESVFPYLRNLACFGLGGHQGTGSQYISWIHVQDFVRSTEWLLKNEALSGTFNVTSPDAVTNKEFMKLMRKTYGIPFGIPSPKWLLEIGAIVMGTETELVLKSRWVYPKRLLDSGFRFNFPKAEPAIHELAARRV